MDGFGLLPKQEGNAIIQAKTPFFDYLASDHKAVALHAAGEAVGLPWGEMGNSEVGHLNIGAGRVVLQDFPQINKAIQDGSFFKNQVLLQALDHVKHHASSLHLLGLVSKGAVHAHIDHLYGLLSLAKQNNLKKVFVHAFLDGRDAPARSAPQFIEPLLSFMLKEDIGQLATMIGRYYAMDRDRRWDRTKAAYAALVAGEPNAANPIEALEKQYRQGQSDEFMLPLVLSENSRIQPGDAVVFFNFRADRSIQLTKAFVEGNFEGFERKKLAKLFFATMTNYEHKLPVDNVFSPIMLNNPETNPLTNPLGEVIATAGLSQLHLAETEKYAHVTYFFNAGRQAAYPKEEQILVPSPKVATYDLAPAMSVKAIVENFVKSFSQKSPWFSVVNFANADMVGHTGDIKAAVEALAFMDEALKQIVELASRSNAIVLVTGDHGNAEQMVNPLTKAIDKEHTVNPVPLVIVERPVEFVDRNLSIDQKLAFHANKPVGIFADVAPTILDYLSISPPPEMTGASLRSLI